MPRFLFALAVFFRARVESLWAQIIFDWVIARARDEWLDYKIEKHKEVADRVRAVLERERKRRESTGGPT